MWYAEVNHHRALICAATYGVAWVSKHMEFGNDVWYAEVNHHAALLHAATHGITEVSKHCP